jgi:hypothetical protein
MSDDSGELVIFQETGKPVEVRLDAKADTVWLTQRQMADVFQVQPQNVTMHLKKIYQAGELAEEATCKDFLQVQVEGGQCGFANGLGGSELV